MSSHSSVCFFLRELMIIIKFCARAFSSTRVTCAWKYAASYIIGRVYCKVYCRVYSSCHVVVYINISWTFSTQVLSRKLRSNYAHLCIVKQEQQWEADCSQVGPRFLNWGQSEWCWDTRIPLHNILSDVHIITLLLALSDTHEVTYNGHDTGNSQTFNVHPV